MEIIIIVGISIILLGLIRKTKTTNRAIYTSMPTYRRTNYAVKPYKYYVYTLSDSRGVFYVGKGTGDRMYAHEREARRDPIKYNTRKHRRIRDALRIDGCIQYAQVFRTNSEKAAFARERKLIRHYGRILTNIVGYGHR